MKSESENRDCPALVKCPFCDAQPEMNKPHVSLGRTFHWVVCSCGACGPESQLESDAVALWNTRAIRDGHFLPNYLWCGRCQAWIETQHACGAQYIDKGTHCELVREAVVLPRLGGNEANETV